MRVLTLQAPRYADISTRGYAGGADLGVMDTREVLSMLRFGAERIFSSDSGQPPSDAVLDDIIDRTSALGAAGDPPPKPRKFPYSVRDA